MDMTINFCMTFTPVCMFKFSVEGKNYCCLLSVSIIFVMVASFSGKVSHFCDSRDIRPSQDVYSIAGFIGNKDDGDELSINIFT